MAADADILKEIASAPDLASVEVLRIRMLGKSGEITAKLKSLGAMDPETRNAEAPRIHTLREAVTDALTSRKAALESA